MVPARRWPRPRAARSARATCSAPGKGRGGAQPPNNWQSVFGGPAWTRVDRRAGRARVVPPPLRHHPARPRLAQPRGAGDVRGRAALLARPRGRRLPGRRGARSVQGEEPARPARSTAPSGRRRRPATAAGRLVAQHRARRADVGPARGARRLPRLAPDPRRSTTATGWRVAEAWTQTPESMARYVRPDELQQAFNFAWLLGAVVGRRLRRRRRAARSRRVAPVGAVADLGALQPRRRSATRRGTAAARSALARARAATLTMLALPGSSYLYQGEELGLEEVDVPPELAAGPRVVPHRQARARRLPGADARGAARAAVRLQPGAARSPGSRCPTTGRRSPSPPSARTPARRGRSTATRCGRDAGSRDAGDDVEVVDAAPPCWSSAAAR